MSLAKIYKTEIAPNLQKKFNFSSIMQVPRLEKVVINMGVGDATKDRKFLDSALEEIGLVTNQKPVITKAKKSIADFKLREGQAVGLKVTLRKQNMWNFVEKLFCISLPSVRDFKGISQKSFDGRGNFTIGLKEQVLFTEITYDQIKKIRGMDITFITSTNSNEHALELLKQLGCPFKQHG